MYYGLVVFTISFCLIFPFLLIPIIFKKQFWLVGVFNRWWAKMIFTFIAIPWSVECRGKLDPKKQYIFCPNHFSYLDIPTMGLNPINAIFVGKSEMENIPLFGFMYRQLHITVNRNKLKSKYTSYKRSQEAIDEGKSLVIFPEGGIISTSFPAMGRFKEGAFRLSVEKQIPIVPVTIATNWIILPDDLTQLTWYPIQVVFHKPIHPGEGGTVDSLRNEVYSIIEMELKKKTQNLLPA